MPNTKSCTFGLARSSTTCVPPRPNTGSRFGDLTIQSGCFSYSSLVVLAISGSIQMPNFTPFFLASRSRPSMPSGSLFLSTTQSPSDELSVLRGYLSPNQPSSMTKSSPPMEAMSAII